MPGEEGIFVPFIKVVDPTGAAVEQASDRIVEQVETTTPRPTTTLRPDGKPTWWISDPHEAYLAARGVGDELRGGR